MCSMLTIKAPERRHWCCSGVFVVNFKYISLYLIFSFMVLLNFAKFQPGDAYERVVYKKKRVLFLSRVIFQLPFIFELMCQVECIDKRFGNHV